MLGCKGGGQSGSGIASSRRRITGAEGKLGRRSSRRERRGLERRALCRVDRERGQRSDPEGEKGQCGEKAKSAKFHGTNLSIPEARGRLARLKGECQPDFASCENLIRERHTLPTLRANAGHSSDDDGVRRPRRAPGRSCVARRFRSRRRYRNQLGNRWGFFQGRRRRSGYRRSRRCRTSSESPRD